MASGLLRNPFTAEGVGQFASFSYGEQFQQSVVFGNKNANIAILNTYIGGGIGLASMKLGKFITTNGGTQSAFGTARDYLILGRPTADAVKKSREVISNISESAIINEIEID